MATLEMVEKLIQKTHVTYEDAKEALQACNDDLLDAVLYLERKGKIPPPPQGGHYSSQHEEKAKEEKAYRPEPQGKAAGERFSGLMSRFFRWCGSVIQKGNSNMFDVVNRQGEIAFSIPVTVLVLLLVFLFWVVLVLLVVGLFFGFRYQFRGEDLGKPAVNHVMSNAAKTVDEIKSELENLDPHKK